MWMWLVAALASEVAMVQADVLNVRSTPNAAAERVARIPQGFAVETLEARDGWTRIRVPNRPVDRAVEGWVRAEYLGPERVEPPPGRGDAPLWVAECHQGRLVVAARVDPDGNVAAQTSEPGGLEPDALVALGWDLAGQWWWSLNGADLGPHRAEPFTVPFLDGVWNPEHDPYTPDEPPGPDQVLVLGACSAEGQWFFSQPVAWVEPRPLRAGELVSRLADLARAQGDGVWFGAAARHPFDDGDRRLEVRLDVPYEWRGDSGRRQATTLRLLDGDRVELEIGAGHPRDAYNPPESVGAPGWFRMGNGRVFGVVPEEFGNGSGLGVLGRTDGGWSVAHARLRAYGC